jgi:hypothetical protein
LWTNACLRITTLAVWFVFEPRIGRSLALSVTTSTGAPCAVRGVAKTRRDEDSVDLHVRLVDERAGADTVPAGLAVSIDNGGDRRTQRNRVE